ncbi:DUF3656 domain-containing protein [Dehalobacterium formicoaceticum]|uniref:DUF3656 domain-containing protein n=1 Tax=Dehalobacterium formicoaceticum TaxID=51515 RepID=A0ABT1Y9N9_9FIRM|nr:DUF3656 domain-containing protein [Dehalobacterium formicoaceticum]MCR6546820.1 DUF3656 domain-containing protein [Dehalobacterium formicoaceticum]
MQIPEILAPAGDFQAFVAAVENGADAVYIGGKVLSARAFAGNFDEDEMAKAVEYAHLRGVRVYVTVNILVDNSEITDAVSYVKTLYDLGVDGLIIQDLGLAFVIHQVLPRMNLHGSTQMIIHNGEGARFIQEMDFKRVVLARELSLEDIAQINKETSLEMEIFVHGALCISYSGQCLMSSLIGGRSGNRGKCAQPCRMTYTLVDEKGQPATDEKIGDHLLSPRDLNTLEILPEICQTGVRSLKLEGRMKRPEYVATVVRIYREALDRYKDDPEHFEVNTQELKELTQIFNRDFTHGYLLGHSGRDLMSYQRPNNRGTRIGRIDEIQNQGQMATIKLDEGIRIGDGLEIWVTKGGRQGFVVDQIISNGRSLRSAAPGEKVSINITGQPRVGDRVFKTHDVKLIETAQNSYLYPQKLIGVKFHLTAHLGKPIHILATDEEGYQGRFTSEYIVEKAMKRPADEESVKKQLNRLGGTAFYLKELLLDLDEGVMLPASELNNARRHVIDLIKQQKLERYAYPPVPNREVMDKFHQLIPAKKESRIRKSELSVRVGSLEGAKAAVEAGADRIYLSGENFQSQPKLTMEQMKDIAQYSRQKGCEVVFALPSIFHPQERSAMYRMIERVGSLPINAMLVNNMGGIQALKESGWDRRIYTDLGLNVFNDFSIDVLREKGIDLITLSLELNFAQIEKMNLGPGKIECLVHGSLPMMINQYCALGSILGGKEGTKACSRPCQGKSFGLKDRMNLIFPVEVDQFCRMHLYNPKELSMLAHADKFLQLGIDSLRIEAQRYSPSAVLQVTQIYRQVIDAASSHLMQHLDLENLEKTLAKMTNAGFTKGHYYRGVI